MNTGFSYTRTLIVSIVVYLASFVIIILFLCLWLIYALYTLVRHMSFKRIESPSEWLNHPLNYIGNLK